MRINKKSQKIIKLSVLLGIFGFWFYLVIDLDVAFNNEMKTLWIHTPSIVEAENVFNFTVEAWDKYERLAGAYTNEISFSIESYNISTLSMINSIYELPKDYKFTSNFFWKGIVPAYKISGADNGKKAFEAKINTPGIHYIIVKDKDLNKEFRSNPIIVKPKGSDFKKIFWGDIHGHTLYSDGSGLPEEAYQFARDVALLDFAALTDHSEHFPRIGDNDVFGEFKNYIRITNEFNQPNRFVTLVAMEWTPDYIVRGDDVANGHLNFYFEGGDMPFFSTLTHQNPYDLYDYVRKNSKSRFMAWTHHTNMGQFGSDFAFYDEKINRLVEIYSIHGSSETYGDDNLVHPVGEIQEPGYSVRDALRMGRKLGIMSSSDTHDGRLGHSIVHTSANHYNQYPYTLAGYRLYHRYRGGITGIFAKKLSRESVFNALYNRSCFASTWVSRPYIEFKINGLSVGINDSTVIVPEKNSTRNIYVLVAADGVSLKADDIVKITRINIYKNSELWKSFDKINSLLFKTNLNDTDDISGTSYDDCIKKNGNWFIHKDSLKSVDPSELNTNGEDYYYLRAEFSNNAIAWIGPIWIQVKT